MGKQSVVVFDLDDTLYKEIDYLKSAYREIARRLVGDGAGQEALYAEMLQYYRDGKNAFAEVESQYSFGWDIADYLSVYRTHFPDIALDKGAADLLSALVAQGCIVGLLTDGRSVTQRNKISALGLTRYIANGDIIVSEEFGSEKPAEANYRYFMDRHPSCRYVYVGDNPKKDFVTPNRLGWTTVCLLDDDRNIHPQDFSLPTEYLPQREVENIVILSTIDN